MVHFSKGKDHMNIHTGEKLYSWSMQENIFDSFNPEESQKLSK